MVDVTTETKELSEEEQRRLKERAGLGGGDNDD